MKLLNIKLNFLHIKEFDTLSVKAKITQSNVFENSCTWTLTAERSWV